MPTPSRHAHTFSSCPHLLVMPTPSRHAYTFAPCPHLRAMPAPSRHARTFSSCPHLRAMPTPSRHAPTFSSCPRRRASRNLDNMSARLRQLTPAKRLSLDLPRRFSYIHICRTRFPAASAHFSKPCPRKKRRMLLER